MIDEPSNSNGDDEYPVRPAEPEVPPRQPAVFRPWGDPADAEPPGDERFQFSLAELLVLVTAVSVLLAAVRTLPGENVAKAAAGWLGLAVLAGMIALAVLKPARPIFHVGWWAMLGIYVLSSALALLLG